MAELNIKIDLTDEAIEQIANKLLEYGDLQFVTRCANCRYFSDNKTFGMCHKYDAVVTAYNYCGNAKGKEE